MNVWLFFLLLFFFQRLAFFFCFIEMFYAVFFFVSFIFFHVLWQEFENVIKSDDKDKNTIGMTDDGIKQIYEKNRFMSVLKIIFYNHDGTISWMECYCSKTVYVLLILLCQYKWQQQQMGRKTTKKKNQEKCKDTDSKNANKQNRNGDGALYFNQCIFSSINILLKALNKFLNNVKHYESKKDGNATLRCVDVKLKTGNTYNIVIELQFLLISILVLIKTGHHLHLLFGCESFFKLSLLFIWTQLLNYKKKLLVLYQTASNFFKWIHAIVVMLAVIVHQIHVGIIQMIFLCPLFSLRHFSGVMNEFFPCAFVFDVIIVYEKKRKDKTMCCSADIFVVFFQFCFCFCFVCVVWK